MKSLDLPFRLFTKINAFFIKILPKYLILRYTKHYSLSKESFLASRKLYRGAYNYYRDRNLYCEETFEVFESSTSTGLNFVSELLSRVSTGELLKVSVDYTVNKNYIPTIVTIDHSLGNEQVLETYEFNSKHNKLKYTFKSKEEEDITKELSTGPIFHIMTPSVCTSMLFLRSKKFNSTGVNNYSIYNNSNQWRFEEGPQMKNLQVEKISQGPEDLTLGASKLQATQYKIFANQNDDTLPEPGNEDFISIYTSPYVTIPYLVKSSDTTSIEVKYLNDLTDSDK